MIKSLANPINKRGVSLRINSIIGGLNTVQNKRMYNQNKMVNNQQKNNQASLVANYSSALINFRALPADIVKKVNATRFEDKLAYSLNRLGGRDILIAAKTPEIAYNTIARIIDGFTVPMEKLYLLTEKKLNETLVFTHTGSKQRRFWNLNETPMLVNGVEILMPESSRIVSVGEHIKVTNKHIEIKSMPETDFNLGDYASLFLREINFEDDAHAISALHNRKMVERILVPENAKNLEKQKNTISFSSVGGQDEVIDALKKNILYPLKYPKVFEGYMLSRGAILHGIPGTGKSLLAQALVAEAGASAFEQAATEFSAKYVGESEENCRELFRKAVEAQPSVIFLDEIDALGKSRGQDVHGDKLLNQFLSCMSDLEKNGDQVFIIGATNKKEDLDPALVRSGRFDLMLEVKAPDLKGTKQILDIKTKGKPLDKDVDIDSIAQEMYKRGMTGADITLMVKNAHTNALERAKIYESMETGRFSYLQLESFRIKNEDFLNAIEAFKSNNSKKHNPVGYITKK